MAENGGRKFDNGKPPVMTGVFLRFPRAMKSIAEVSQLGADKYEVTLPDDGFLRVPNGGHRYTDALGRHLLDRAISGTMNKETGGALSPEGRTVRHLAQAAWDILTVLELEIISEEKAASEQNDCAKDVTKDYPWKEVYQDGSYRTVHDLSTTSPPLPPLPHSHSHIVSMQGYIPPTLGGKHRLKDPVVQAGSADIFVVK